MPRKNGLLSLRALNSFRNTLGAYISASCSSRTSASRNVSGVTAVTLTGSDCKSAGCFWAVTVTDGSLMGELVSSDELGLAASGAADNTLAAASIAGIIVENLRNKQKNEGRGAVFLS